MPSVLTWATVLLASAGASGTLAVVGAYVLAGAISVGFSIGANALIGALFGPGRPAPSDGQSISDDPVGSHRRNYGIVHTGGQRTFRESRNGTIGQVITLGLEQGLPDEAAVHGLPCGERLGGLPSRVDLPHPSRRLLEGGRGPVTSFREDA